MKQLIILLFLLILVGCGGSNNSHLVEKPKSCTVKTNSLGAIIKCPDGSETFISNGKNGLDGKSCKVEQLSNGAKISCEDGSFAYIYDGAKGNSGENGSSCTVVGSNDEAIISCEDGSSATIANGKDGKSCTITDLLNGALISCGNESVVIFDGTNGVDGEDALSDAIGIANYIFPCGKEFNGDEVLLKLTDGNILALYDGGPNEDRLALLYPGNWITTDRNKNHTCHFTIDSNLNIINEYVD